MSALLAAILALDQRIDLQLPLMLLLGLVAARGAPDSVTQPGKAVLALSLSAMYLASNSLATFTDDAGIPPNWWAAPLRIWLYYFMLIAMAVTVKSRLHGDRIFNVLEWLFLFKLCIIAFEGYALLESGVPREKPLFNIILDADTLLGVRFTSSYDFLFALLVLSPRHGYRRLLIVVALLVISETRALLLLTLVLLAWRLWRTHSPWLLGFVAACTVAAITATAIVQFQADESPRLFQFSGSSLDDKVDQVDAVADLVWSPNLLVGRGVGVPMPGLVRDELRPYSYEAQVPVLLWQGGILFFVVHIAIISWYAESNRVAATLLILGLGFLNPTLFSLASAYFIAALGRAINIGANERRHDSLRRHYLHAQRPPIP